MAQERDSSDLGEKEAAVVFRDIPDGTTVTLLNGAVAEVVGNPRDGAWLLIRFIEHPADPGRVGQEDMVFYNEVQSVRLP